MTSSQETERVYSYNPGARTGPFIWSICILFFLQLSFNGQSGPTWVSRYQNVKPSWILLQQEIMEVVMMPIRNISCANPQSNHHHQHTSTQFLQAGCPSYHQTNSVKALKASIYFCISQKIVSWTSWQSQESLECVVYVCVCCSDCWWAHVYLQCAWFHHSSSVCSPASHPPSRISLHLTWWTSRGERQWICAVFISVMTVTNIWWP